MVLSALMILAAVLAIFIPPAAGLAVTILVGWLLAFSGVAHLVFCAADANQWRVGLLLGHYDLAYLAGEHDLGRKHTRQDQHVV
jgi:uncharacterized membrane protein HdeD (DUF308 family)